MIDPSIALQYRPVEIANPLQSYAQALSLKNLALQNQTGQLELEEKKRALAESQVLRDIYRQVAGASPAAAQASPAVTPSAQPVSNYDFVNALNNGAPLPAPAASVAAPAAPAPGSADPHEEIYRRAAASGQISPRTLQQMRDALLETRAKYASLSETERKVALGRNTAMQGRLASILAEKDDAKLPALWDQRVREGIAAGDLSEQEAALHPFPGTRAGVEQYAASLNLDNWALSQEHLAGAKNSETRTALEVRAQKLQDASRLLSVKDPVQYAQNYGALSADPYFKQNPDLLAQFDAPSAFNAQTSPAKAADLPLTAEQRAQLSLRAKEVAKLNTPAQLAMMAAKGDKDAQAALELLKNINIEERKVSAVNPNIYISPEGMQLLGNQYLTTGALPTIPRGPGGQVAANVINQTAKVTGGAFDPGATKAEYQADSASLASLQKQRDAVVTFEKTAKANLDQFVSLAGKLPDTGLPWLNTPLRMLNEKLVGNEWAPAVNAARQIAVNEIAKVTSNPTLSGALSDSARHEVAEYNPANATLQQTLRVAQVLRQDMANRHKFFDEGIAEIKGRIGRNTNQGATGGGAGQNAGAPAPSGAPGRNRGNF
jgi:hypothetical protein